MVSSPTRPLSLQERRRWRILCPTIHRRGALCGSSADWRPHLSSSGRGRHRDAPYEDVLGQMVTIREGGTERRVLADEAFLLQLAKRGVEGDSAARASLAVIEEARERQGIGECPISAIVMVGLVLGSVTSALEPLRMATKFDPYRETARNRARTMARRGRIGPPPPATQSPRSAD